MADWPYNLAAWKRLRRAKLAKDPLCQYCPPGRIRPANEVDHFTSIADEGDPWSWDNLASACRPCHSRKTAVFDRSFGRAPAETVRQRGVDPDTGLPLDQAHWWNDGSLALPRGLPRSKAPLRMVCGPSGSGKTTYAREHANGTDLVIDLDAIKAELSGTPWYEAGEAWVAPALKRRNELLRALGKDDGLSGAWFIVSAPGAMERSDWARMLKPVEVIVLAEPIEVCVGRLQGDERRAARWPYYGLLARSWWRKYTPRVWETVTEKNRSELRIEDRRPKRA